MKTFVIDKKTWYCGRAGNSALLRSDGMKCCLGFACLQLGAKGDEIEDRWIPSNAARFVTNKVSTLFEKMGLLKSLVWLNQDKSFNSTPLVDDLVVANDKINKQSKKARLATLNKICTEYDAPFRFAFEED